MLEFNDYKKNLIQNKYLDWYIQIVQANIHRKKQDKKIMYLEAHHILPKSMGGSDEPTNIVYLPLKTHFVIHHLLTKFCTGDDLRKMNFAFRCFLFGVNKNRDGIISEFLTANRFEKLKIQKLEELRKDNREGRGKPSPRRGVKIPKENAMKYAEVRRRNGSYGGEKQRQVMAAIPKEQRLKSIEQGKNTYFKNGSNIRESKRMKENNPMYREDVMRRGVETRNIYYNSPSFRYKCVMDLMVKYGYDDPNKFVYDFMTLIENIKFNKELTGPKKRKVVSILIEFHQDLGYHSYKICIKTINKLLECLNKE